VVTANAAQNHKALESLKYFDVLGVRFAAVQIEDVIREMEEWISTDRRTHCISVSNVHSVIESQNNPGFMRVLNTSDLNVPDGMPIIWMGRSQGHRLPRRVYGPDLFMEFCLETQDMPYRHFFYGAAPEVLELLVENFKKQFPGIKVAGFYAPPFRPLTEEEDLEVIEIINDAAPDVLWVGLGCPKQEFWISAHRESIHVPVIAGIGQAFNIYAGQTRQAPKWLREHGLEWLFRLILEPRRLWRRYLIGNLKFIFGLFRHSLRWRANN
jgi:N-acetylglucosaminyldiphosphoundecaprenol N-acetyl-beta-D-mannosaminyltransferase